MQQVAVTGAYEEKIQNATLRNTTGAFESRMSASSEGEPIWAALEKHIKCAKCKIIHRTKSQSQILIGNGAVLSRKARAGGTRMPTIQMQHCYDTAGSSAATSKNSTLSSYLGIVSHCILSSRPASRRIFSRQTGEWDRCTCVSATSPLPRR